MYSLSLSPYTFTTFDTQTPEPVAMTTKGFYGNTGRYSKSTEYDSLPLELTECKTRMCICVCVCVRVTACVCECE